MILTDAAAFRALPDLPITAPTCARGVYLVAPEGFSIAAQSATDNVYMHVDAGVDPTRALAQHRALQRGLATQLPAICFAGDPETPDAVFPNNVFATAPGRLILGHMRHPVRQREAERADIRRFFTDVLGYATVDLRQQPGICELTGSLIVDRGRGIGYHGLSERCDAVGAAAMHAAFGLQASFVFPLAPGEYHTNVVMSVLASRAVVLCRAGFANPADADAIAARYAPHVIALSVAEKNAFAANCIAVTPDVVWMSRVAADALSPASRAAFASAQFRIEAVELDEIEKAGGSLRCCVGEIF